MFPMSSCNLFQVGEENFEIQEEFVDLYEVAFIGAETTYTAITNVFLCLYLSISKVHG